MPYIYELNDIFSENSDQLMRIVDSFRQNETLISFEILPPLKGGSIDSVFKAIDPLMEFKPAFVDVTYHREEFIYVKRDSGYYEKTSIRKRPGTVGICAAIMHRYKIEPVPHLICGGFTQEDTENALIDLNFLGISNVLALRGDPRPFEKSFQPEPGGHHYALGLVEQIGKMNRGIYLDKNLENGYQSKFCIGVAGYPEKHFEAPNRKIDLEYTKAKVDAGADYVVTQMFFDNCVFEKYIDDCRKSGIHAPIVPGIKPITKLEQMSSIPRNFFISFPEEFVKEMQKTKSPVEAKQVGIEWCITQSKELIKMGVPCLHFYTMGDSKTVQTILRAVL